MRDKSGMPVPAWGIRLTDRFLLKIKIKI